jgi:hypothetical protein
MAICSLHKQKVGEISNSWLKVRSPVFAAHLFHVSVVFFLDRFYSRSAFIFDRFQLMKMLLFAFSKSLGSGGGFFLHFRLQSVAVSFEQAIPER